MLEAKQQSGMLLVCVTVAGLALLASSGYYRDDVLRGFKKFCQRPVNKKQRARRNEDNVSNDDDDPSKKKVSTSDNSCRPKNVILADSIELCDYAVERIRCNSSDKVLGFDCEWTNEGPVSLLQLSTRSGVCALFRLNKIGHVPQGLKELLASRELLKVGVGPNDDGRKLAKDYECQVSSTVDLRNLSQRLGMTSPRSLSALCVHYLGVEINKATDVRCGDWNAESLTDEQIVYASTDAYVSVLIYHEIMKRSRQKRNLWDVMIRYAKKYLYCLVNARKDNTEFFDLPQGVIDTKFKGPSDNGPATKRFNDLVSKKNDQKISSNKSNCQTSEYKNINIPARNKPLYHNCYLQAPDGETLCTCDKKKAEWYVSKQLGEIVKNEPFTVRLKFEPSGRASGEVGKYYTQVKLNQCVVCGASEKFIRKNVIPREYRKHFPTVMKSHQSHDILLLCPKCHQESNNYDLQLRRELAKKCDAPLTSGLLHVREEIPQNWKLLKTAVGVLRDQKRRIPLARREELQAIVLKNTDLSTVTLESLDCLNEQIKMPSSKNNFLDRVKKTPVQTNIQPHGLKVVEYFKNREGGLINLEKFWREHFVNSMKPKYLPELWSVSHNQERLNIRRTQNRIELKDAELAGIVF